MKLKFCGILFYVLHNGGVEMGPESKKIVSEFIPAYD